MTGTAQETPGSGDAVLVARLRAGDEEAFAGLVDGWAGWMLRLARHHVSSPGVAEEVVQDTWLAVLEGLATFRGEASLRTWVFRILLNQAKRRGVRDSRTIPFASLGAQDAGPSVDPANFQGADETHPGGWRRFPEEWPEQWAERCPEQVAQAREMRDVVTAALAELPARQRTVVALRDLDGHTSEEVCELLGVSSGNQRVLLHRGRAVVRAHVERYYAGASTADAPVEVTS
jgi:RNA polymerase sigma-70 factor (ECF subfamily)